MTDLQLWTILAHFIAGSAELRGPAFGINRGGQDTSRKVRPVGWARKASKDRAPAHIAERIRKLPTRQKPRIFSPFHTLRQSR